LWFASESGSGFHVAQLAQAAALKIRGQSTFFCKFGVRALFREMVRRPFLRLPGARSCCQDGDLPGKDGFTLARSIVPKSALPPNFGRNVL
jgi:hypothetical protein